jgi:hypothetical protein
MTRSPKSSFYILPSLGKNKKKVRKAGIHGRIFSVCLVFLKHIIQILNYMFLMVLFLMKIRPCCQIVFQCKIFPPFAWEYDKIGIDCITFIWNSSLAMMCLIMFQSIVFVPWLVHDEHSSCISIINLISWCAVQPLW